MPKSVSDSATIKFGVREFTSDQSGKNGARQFYVNRRKIFIRGTNWIPEGMLRQDDARMEKEMRLTAESGVNLVRLWAGGIAESDRFYDLCDEYGLLVWQEFWMTGDTRHPDDPGLYLDCVAQQVKRIRHHASISHWVCSNESTDVQGVEELVKRLTGTTSWMQNSECDRRCPRRLALLPRQSDGVLRRHGVRQARQARLGLFARVRDVCAPGG